MHTTALRVPQASNGAGRSMPAPLAPGLGAAPFIPQPFPWDEPGFLNGTLIDQARHQVLIAECQANCHGRYSGRDFSELPASRVVFWSELA